MIIKHFSAYTLIVSLVLAIKCDQPPLPLLPIPQPMQLNGIIKHAGPLINQQVPNHYPMDYEDSEPSNGHANTQEVGQVEHTTARKGEKVRIHQNGKHYIVTHMKTSSFKLGGHTGYGQYGEGQNGNEESGPDPGSSYDEKGVQGFTNEHTSRPIDYDKDQALKSASPHSNGYGTDGNGYEHGNGVGGHHSNMGGHHQKAHPSSDYFGHKENYNKYEKSHGNYDTRNGAGHGHGAHGHGGYGHSKYGYGGRRQGGGWAGPEGQGGVKKQILHSDKRKRGGWHDKTKHVREPQTAAINNVTNKGFSQRNAKSSNCFI